MLCESERQVVAQYDGLLVSEPHELKEASFSDRIASLAGGQGKYLIAEVDGEPVAHACLWPMGLEKVSHVLRLDMCVHVGHWRQGYGEGLLRSLLAWARSESGAHKIELLVRSENEGAVALYRKLGFVQEGCMKDRVRLRTGRYIDDISMALLFSASDGAGLSVPRTPESQRSPNR